MSNSKIAFLLGITGQDGSYLAELLLEKGYMVHGVIRRSSSFNTGRIDHIFDHPCLKLHYGDVTDPLNITNLIADIKPDEIYNLSAQSHVKVSFEQPYYTGMVDGLGTLVILEAIRIHCPKAKMYQASTSELFGGMDYNMPKTGYTEESAFHPRSPYGVAKLYGYWITKNYREAYNLFVSNGLLFNHETVADWSPMFYKDKGDNLLDIKPICEIVEFDKTKLEYQAKPVADLQVWGASGWVDVKFASAYPHDVNNDNKKPRLINSGSGVVMATSSHIGFLNGGQEKEFGDITIGDRIETIDLPNSICLSHLSELDAEFLGVMVGRSGYTDEIIGQINAFRATKILQEYRSKIYNKDSTKRIPKDILNATPNIMLAFLRGYNMSDSLNANTNTNLFKTDSPTLAMGLLYLIERTTGLLMNITVDQNAKDMSIYYSINLFLLYGINENHSEEVTKIIEMPDYTGWFYDLETSSGEFHCGIGKWHVHNSPVRGETFVTRKITTNMTQVKKGSRSTLVIGNLDSKRDWGHAKEYVEGMWLMLQQDKPDDFVLATGIAYSVRTFVEMTAKHLGWTIEWIGSGVDEKGYDKSSGKLLVEIDPKYFRPAEVDVLIGDATKAKSVLGWEAKITLEEIVKEMVDHDLGRI